MKKQILTLMLSAAVFATTPLFAMDNESDLFNENKSYRITISQLRSWMVVQNPEKPNSWFFSIGNRRFQLNNDNDNDNDNVEENSHNLHLLHLESHVNCEWSHYNNCFQAGIPVSNYSKSDQIQDLDSVDYCNGVNCDFGVKGSNYTPNLFSIYRRFEQM